MWAGVERPLLHMAAPRSDDDYQEMVENRRTEADPLLRASSGRSSRARTEPAVGTPSFYQEGACEDTSYYALQASDVSHIPVAENPTTVALDVCRDKVLSPYLNFLFSVGWVPVFSYPTSCWQRAVNILHPSVVCAFVLMGYVIQYASCFARYTTNGLRNGLGETRFYPLESANSTDLPPCQRFIISQFIIPDLLHSLAYAYSFYTLRISQSEQLPTLMERVFLQTSTTTTGVYSQRKLIYKLRRLLFAGIIWVVLSQMSQIMHVISQYDQLNFYWLEPAGSFGRVALLSVMLISFVFLDVVYVAVVINYSVQCFLLIFYIRTLTQKVGEKQVDLPQAMKEMNLISDHMRVLNQNPGLALSIVLINFSTLALLGTLSIVVPRQDSFTPLMVASNMISVLLWAAVITTPIVIASVLTSKCAWLRKLGHKTRMRPFGFEDTPLEELDSFLLYTATLTLSAKIFLIPVRGAYVASVVLVVTSTMLLLFQTGVIHVWL